MPSALCTYHGGRCSGKALVTIFGTNKVLKPDSAIIYKRTACIRVAWKLVREDTYICIMPRLLVRRSDSRGEPVDTGYLHEVGVVPVQARQASKSKYNSDKSLLMDVTFIPAFSSN